MKELKNPVRTVLEALITFFVFTGVVLYFRIFIFDIMQVDGNSMAPHYTNGEAVWLNKLDKVPQRGEVNVFYRDGVHIIKRVIAVAGDTVEIKDGEVFVNGEKEEYGYGDTEPDMEAFEVPEGKVWVLGDNRENSLDSRSEIGFLDLSEISGSVI